MLIQVISCMSMVNVQHDCIIKLTPPTLKTLLFLQLSTSCNNKKRNILQRIMEILGRAGSTGLQLWLRSVCGVRCCPVSVRIYKCKMRQPEQVYLYTDAHLYCAVHASVPVYTVYMVYTVYTVYTMYSCTQVIRCMFTL